MLAVVFRDSPGIDHNGLPFSMPDKSRQRIVLVSNRRWPVSISILTSAPPVPPIFLGSRPQPP